MPINLVALADALIEQLIPQLPRGCWIERWTDERAGIVWLRTHTAGGLWAGTGMAGTGLEVEEHDLADVVDIALDGLQDHVVEARHGIRWPDDPASSEPIPLSWARVDGGYLLFGYGTQTLGNIRLSDLGA